MAIFKFAKKIQLFRERLNLTNSFFKIGFQWILYWISGFFPRDKELWLFGTVRDGFSDNALHLFIHLVQRHPNIRAIWVTGSLDVLVHIRKLGYTAVHRNSFIGTWIALRARYYFFTHYVSDINFFTSRGAKLINLWHGSPLKKIEFDVDNGPSARRYVSPTCIDRFIDFPEVYICPDYVLSSSRFVSEYMLSSAFRIPISQCLELGYPRLDLLFFNSDEIFYWLKLVGDNLSKEWLEKIIGFKRIILYLPTWRDSGVDIFEDNPIDFFSIDKLCHDNNCIFIVKLHQFSVVSSALDKLIKKCSHVFIAPASTNTYVFMSVASMLVTDYSSVIFEFILTHRPIFLYTPDIENFLLLQRSFYMDLEEVKIGKIIKSPDEFTVEFRDFLYSDIRRNYQDELIGKYNKFVDGNACQRIAEHFSKKQ